MDQIAQKYRQNINKQLSNAYYMANPQEVREINRRGISNIDVQGEDIFDPGNIQDIFKTRMNNTWIFILIIVILVGAFWLYRRSS